MKWQKQQDDQNLPYEPKYYKRDPEHDDKLTMKEIVEASREP